MKKIYIFTVLLISTSLNAQFITIPDANFSAFLQTNYPTCMDGDELDIDCAAQLEITEINLANLDIVDLTGVEYFTSLTQLFCHNNSISNLPALPPNLEVLICSNNELVTLPALPETLVYLYCGNNQLSTLPELPYGLIELMCYNNQLTNLSELPNTIDYMVASNNQITEISNLPNVLTFLDVTNNALTTLPELPLTMTALACSNNQLTALPELPNLTTLQVENNLIQCFPVFPSSINPPILNFVFLTIQGNPFTCLPNHTLAMTDDLLEYPICTNDPDINPNGCGSVQSASVNAFEQTSVVFPNPTVDFVNFYGTNMTHVKVFNQMGQEVKVSISMLENSVQLDFTSAPSGVYFVHFNSNGEPNIVRITRL